jgi:hypothetical protein
MACQLGSSAGSTGVVMPRMEIEAGTTRVRMALPVTRRLVAPAGTDTTATGVATSGMLG